MTLQELRQLRIAAHKIHPATPPGGSKSASIHAIVRHLACVQAQEAPPARWNIALRVPGTTEADIQQAVAERRIARSWSLRGTLQFMAAEDLRWITALTGEAMNRRAAGLAAKLGLDANIFAHARARIAHHLQGRAPMPRKQLIQLLADDGLPAKGITSTFILYNAAESGLVCMGPDTDKDETFVLVDEWLPPTPPLSRDEAAATLCLRYFRSHGPATLDDFGMFSGMNQGDCKRALAACQHQLHSAEFSGKTHHFAPDLHAPAAHPATLLGAFDEAFVSYRDRSPVLDPEFQFLAMSSNGIFRPTLLVQGRLAGTWARTVKARHVEVKLQSFEPLAKQAIAELEAHAQQYARFLGKEEARVSLEGKPGELYRKQ